MLFSRLEISHFPLYKLINFACFLTSLVIFLGTIWSVYVSIDGNKFHIDSTRLLWYNELDDTKLFQEVSKFKQQINNKLASRPETELMYC